jgi:hypothetical protein
MPVEFLTDDKVAAYGRYAGAPSQVDLERVFFLDDQDRALVDLRRGDHMKAGFALQLVTVRWLGTFLEDPLDVPGAVLDFVAAQLGLADPSVVKRYPGRVKTKSDHQQEIRRTYGLRHCVAQPWGAITGSPPRRWWRAAQEVAGVLWWHLAATGPVQALSPRAPPCRAESVTGDSCRDLRPPSRGWSTRLTRIDGGRR